MLAALKQSACLFCRSVVSRTWPANEINSKHSYIREAGDQRLFQASFRREYYLWRNINPKLVAYKYKLGAPGKGWKHGYSPPPFLRSNLAVVRHVCKLVTLFTLLYSHSVSVATTSFEYKTRQRLLKLWQPGLVQKHAYMYSTNSHMLTYRLYVIYRCTDHLIPCNYASAHQYSKVDNLHFSALQFHLEFAFKSLTLFSFMGSLASHPRKRLKDYQSINK